MDGIRCPSATLVTLQPVSLEDAGRLHLNPEFGLVILAWDNHNGGRETSFSKLELGQGLGIKYLI